MLSVSTQYCAYAAAVLLESRNGRYEAHRSICIRFLSRDDGVDDVIWSHVTMRTVDDVATTIVCWNQVMERRAAVELRRRFDDEDKDDVDVVDTTTSGGPPRPSPVVQLEQEEVLRSPQRHLLCAAHGDDFTVQSESSDTSFFYSNRCDVRATSNTQEHEAVAEPEVMPAAAIRNVWVDLYCMPNHYHHSGIHLSEVSRPYSIIAV